MDLFIPITYEQIVHRLGEDIAPYTNFIEPLATYESQLLEVLHEITQDGIGRVLFVFGTSGAGKSSFIGSLRWRNLPIRRIEELNAYEYAVEPGKSALLELYVKIYAIANEERKYTDSSKTVCVVLNNMETLEGEEPGTVDRFFRQLNGLLRRVPLLILWPVTKEDDLENMLRSARKIGTTLVSSQRPVMYFAGPEQNLFSKIARNTIRVLNNGREYDEFHLSERDFEKALIVLDEYRDDQQTIRNYLQLIKNIWNERTEQQKKYLEHIPFEIELWIVLCYPEAEDIVDQFTRPSYDPIENNYRVDPSRLAEYTRPGTELANKWPNSELDLALGIVHTKILFIPTHSFVMSMAAFGPSVKGFPFTEQHMKSWELDSVWYTDSRIALTLPRSPLIHQLSLKETPAGKYTTHSQVRDAIERARPAFTELSQWIASSGGSDQPFNKALAKALSKAYNEPHTEAKLPLERPGWEFVAEKRLPFLTSVRPDITAINEAQRRHICIEMHYTQQSSGYELARYTLTKLLGYWSAWKALRASGQRGLL